MLNLKDLYMKENESLPIVIVILLCMHKTLSLAVITASVRCSNKFEMKIKVCF